ncbi:ABC transporter ATP-binding protein [Bifidobacterium simiarum]|uniref:ABC transporter ATP-binding protein n=1 Tax=Bifidobacterium simiarum TaxID=2045441 RepID=A0A2M9HHC9_9BIFI|nr:ATP-binding cassette domain-containing protein [Bifidobacterium simiarum]MBT1165230.1 ATP-binding cassette domain-containing protein [Bifidobacterium simiarum]PJM76230.1 ABC transporter ATP-binding protein [Bifidobacterium simiarum]
MSMVFSARDVSCTVGGRRGDVGQADGRSDGGVSDRTIFSGISFAIDEGQIVDLTGPSGSGKTSLLTAFARLNPNAHGTFMLDGRDASEFTVQQWRRAVAYLPQKPVLIGERVADVIRLPFTLAVRRERERSWSRRLRSLLHDVAPTYPSDDDIRAALDAVGCDDIELTRSPHELSGGQAARVSLIRTLMTKPRMLLADEVDAGLDDDNAEKVARIMAHAAGNGMAVVRIRHRPPDGHASRIIELAHGELHERTLA